MKVVDCFWEKKNLMKNVAEVTLDKDELIDIETINDLESQFDYIVCKVYANNTDQCFSLSKLGYVFMETQFSLSKKVNAIDQDNKLIKLIEKKSSIKNITTQDELDELLLLITDDMFSTDRIYLDPSFGAYWSRYRYQK